MERALADVQPRSNYGGFSIGGAQPISDPCLRENVLRPLGIGFDFLAKLPHIDSQILRIGRLVPQLSEQEFVSEYLPCMLHQHAQKLVLLGRKLYILFSDSDSPTDEVDRQIADRKDWPFAVDLKLVTE